MNPRKWTLSACVGLALALSSPPSRAQQPRAGVELVLAPSLRDSLPRIDLAERHEEQYFRAHRTYDGFGSARERGLAADAIFSAVRWANEAVVPDSREYGVESLLEGLVAECLRQAGVNGDAVRIRITLERLGVKNHPVASIRAANDFATGKIEVFDPAVGGTPRGTDVVANLLTDSTADRSFQGPGLAFADTDADRRVGPTLAYFVSKGLSRLFPDRDFPKVVSVLFGERAPSHTPSLRRGHLG